MNSNPDEFETLRKLMALKRHEQPPPEYLHQLSGAIRTRIERGEGQLNVWDKLSANFSLRPSVAYAFGLTVCGALSLSAIYMVKQEMAQSADFGPGTVLRGPSPMGTFATQINPSTPPLHVANWLGNTNPSVEPQGELSFFNTGHVVRTVSYQTGN
jgi:hypothetical protein